MRTNSFNSESYEHEESSGQAKQGEIKWNGESS